MEVDTQEAPYLPSLQYSICTYVKQGQKRFMYFFACGFVGCQDAQLFSVSPAQHHRLPCLACLDSSYRDLPDLISHGKGDNGGIDFLKKGSPVK